MTARLSSGDGGRGPTVADASGSDLGARGARTPIPASHGIWGRETAQHQKAQSRFPESRGRIEDPVYIGKCPDLITGIHGDDPVQVYKELGEVVQEVIDHFQQTSRELPPVRTRP